MPHYYDDIYPTASKQLDAIYGHAPTPVRQAVETVNMILLQACPVAGYTAAFDMAHISEAPIQYPVGNNAVVNMIYTENEVIVSRQENGHKTLNNFRLAWNDSKLVMHDYTPGKPLLNQTEIGNAWRNLPLTRQEQTDFAARVKNVLALD